ncbi:MULTISPECIES: hypothetical protein [Kitasatospora]|uniref:Uncharacterized protein n=1 Tax=Kitasatospora setae (strain ATCC 33774 / DSM 43861 / JCM 3304 / KCC A-0304 / NBRC 14216 / KM-6054) TaxID=452652 RepID=E4N463_KITSK|nr:MULTISPECIES: hypothetical protein [Kitasatospora]BAJ25994.1 hypothetical protein KSE_01430 [Kitasatospora setae KM-6054]
MNPLHRRAAAAAAPAQEPTIEWEGQWRFEPEGDPVFNHGIADQRIGPVTEEAPTRGKAVWTEALPNSK